MDEQQLQHRYLSLDEHDASSDVFELSFSSEEPVERSLGTLEVLQHTEEAVDFSRLNGGVAPFLFNHDPDVVLGVVESASVSNGRGYASVRWGTSPEALQKRADVAAGILSAVSVGYRIDQTEFDPETNTLTATRWTPVEVSLVSIPADPSVGIGRSIEHSQPQPITMQRSIATPIASGAPDEFGQATQQFSIVRALQAAAGGDWRSAGLEREVSQELQLRENRTSGGFLVPAEAWGQRAYQAGTASAGGDLIGTSLLADRFVDSLRARLAVAQLGATMLPGLQGNVSIPRRTATATSYWIGADDDDAVTESTGTFGSISMTPKTVGAYSRFSRLMQLQSTPDIETLIRRDFIALLAEAIDAAAINGSGSSSEPEGILQVTGVGAVIGGTDGAAPTLDHMIDLKKAVSIDNADVATAGFLTTPQVEAALAKLTDDQGNYILNPYSRVTLNPFGNETNRALIAGRQFYTSTNVPSDLTKGSGTDLSAIIYGNFADLLIGMWGSLEVLVDPYSDFAKGSVGVRALQSVDIAVRHPESFAIMTDAIA